ncbi:MAG TPA: VWA domain-containing protein [bacterium]|nr:VWA domain-containing protein [bacterium]
MTFGLPWVLPLLLLPLLVFIRRLRGKREATLLVGDARAFADLPRSWRQRLTWLPPLLRMLAVAALIFAASRPMLTKTTENITSEGIDIMLTLDVSGSMQAPDFQPRDRMYVAKLLTTQFIEQRIGDRLGLVLFAGKAVTQCPLTVDHGIVVQQVQAAEAGQLGDGTAIGMALASAANRLRDAPGKSRVIVLLTDGNNNTGKIDPLTAARMAAALKTKIYAIGVGRRGAQAVIDPGGFGRPPQVTEELDEETLKKVAEAGGGKYFRATDAQGLKKIFDEIDRMEKTQVEREKATHFTDKFEPLLWLGLVLLLVELLLAGGPLRKVS